MDARTRRRRAALAVLDGLLDEADLIDALWLSQSALGGDSVSDIIRFIDLLAERHGIEPATCKRLYQALHGALRRGDAELPLDPWPLMAAARPAAIPAAPPWQPPMPPKPPAPSPPAPPLPASPVPEAGALPGAAAVPGPGLASASPAARPPEADSPAEQAVFAELVAAVSALLAQLHPTRHADWREACRDQLLRGRRLPPDLQQALVIALDSLQPDADPALLRQAWRLGLPPAGLAEHLTLVYVALCEALGPVHADQVLTQAVRQAEQHPAARLFSPRRLL